MPLDNITLTLASAYLLIIKMFVGTVLISWFRFAFKPKKRVHVINKIQR